MHEPVHTRPHPADPLGEQRIYRFPNGQGASVVRFQYSYGAEDGKWELAVLKFHGPEPFDYHLDYTTPITNDVEGHLTLDEVDALLDKIEALPDVATHTVSAHQ